MAVGPAFSGFDMPGGHGFAFGVFCVTLIIPSNHRTFWFRIADIARCCLIFLTDDGLRNERFKMTLKKVVTQLGFNSTSLIRRLDWKLVWA